MIPVGESGRLPEGGYFIYFILILFYLPIIPILAQCGNSIFCQILWNKQIPTHLNNNNNNYNNNNYYYTFELLVYERPTASPTHIYMPHLG